MNEPTLVDRTFHIIMRRMVETGQAPHFTEIAADLGVSMRRATGASCIDRDRFRGLVISGDGSHCLNGTLSQFTKSVSNHQSMVSRKWFAQ